MIRLVLFDIDGTLIRTHGAGVRAFARAFQTEFAIASGAERLSFAGRTDTSLVQEFFRLHHREPTLADTQRFIDRYVFLLDHYLETSQGGVIPGVLDWMNKLGQLPHPPQIGLLTGNIRLGAEIKLRRYALWERFAVGAFADDSEDRNQIARVAFQRARRQGLADLRPDEVLVVGDTPHDVSCGRSISAKVLAVATGGASEETLRASRADWTVQNLSQIDPAEVCA